MGFLQLFVVASIPVIKVLLITALGLFLAFDHIDILGEDSRQKVNHLVFYVFNPSLVGSSLANTITYESFVLLWFMPVNILATFIIGSALGWILIKITRPPKHIEGLILGCCSAGNLGNLLIIILPAVCKEKGSPFGDPEICSQYGLAYASLSMAIGAVFLWSYVYNIMRISTNRLQSKGDTKDDPSKLKASEEIPQSHTDSLSETLNPAKGTLEDAYTLLLPSTESEEKKKIPISDKIKHCLRKISRNINLGAMLAPSTSGAITGFIIGVVPVLHNFMIGTNAPLRVVEESATLLGQAAIPTTTIIMGANLLRGLKGANTPVWTVVGIVVVRYIFLPLMGIVVVKGAIHLGLVQQDPLYRFLLLLQYALPPAMNIGTMAQLFGVSQSECSVIMLWTYALASIAVTLWATCFMWLVS